MRESTTVLMMPHAPAMTPKLMPPASRIFSRRGMRRDQMNIHGKPAKKKSQALDHTAGNVSTP